MNCFYFCIFLFFFNANGFSLLKKEKDFLIHNETQWNINLIYYLQNSKSIQEIGSFNCTSQEVITFRKYLLGLINKKKNKKITNKKKR